MFDEDYDDEEYEESLDDEPEFPFDDEEFEDDDWYYEGGHWDE